MPRPKRGAANDTPEKAEIAALIKHIETTHNKNFFATIFGNALPDVHYWLVGQSHKIHSTGTKFAFNDLCNQGCSFSFLSTMVYLLDVRAVATAWWIEILGNKNKKERLVSSLSSTSFLLQDIFGPILPWLKDHSNDNSHPLSPLTLITTVDEYRQAFELLLLFTKNVKVSSYIDLIKYFLTKHVWIATSAYHDKEVSLILGEILGTHGYDADSHRKWRNRSLSRLETQLLAPFTVLSAFIHRLEEETSPPRI